MDSISLKSIWWRKFRTKSNCCSFMCTNVFFLILNNFDVAPCTAAYPTYSYDFSVFPVAECPMNSSAFDLAAKRMNCTTNYRYLCSPDNKLRHLIEFCTDRTRKLYGPDSCVRLEGAGDLNHFKCIERFTEGCPNTAYFDDQIYNFPECLHINTLYNCFYADKNCSHIHILPNNSRENSNANLVWKIVFSLVGLFTPIVILLIILSLLYWRNIRNKKEIENSDMAKLKKILGKKYVKISHARCIIVGCTKAGKTTLLKRLQDKPYKEVLKVKETLGIDVHFNGFKVHEDTIKGVKNPPETPYILISPDELVKNEFEDAEGGLTSEENAREDISEDAAESIKFLVNNEEAELSNTDTSKKEIYSDEKSCTDTESTVNDEVKMIPRIKEKTIDTIDVESYAMEKIMRAVHRLGENIAKTPFITFLDFAGQYVYYAFHQIYITPKTIYILVVDMTKKFTDINEVDRRGPSGFSSWTYKEYHKFWLKSIDSFGDTQAPVIVVATHAENKSNEECQEFLEEFYALFNEREDLQRHLHTKRFFFIKFPSDGSKLEDVDDIKKCICKLAQVYLNEKMRSAWAIFEHIVEREKVQRKVISKDDLLKYNNSLPKSLRMNEEEITRMLLFLHRVGSVLYFDEEGLQNTIILDVQWFADAFKYILTGSVDVQKATDRNRTVFYDTGELKDDDLEEIWTEHEELLKHKKEILLFMEKLGLLAICASDDSTVSGKNDDWYYFPSLNKRKFPQGALDNYTTSSILCFQFDEEGQLPIFLFYALVLKCFKLPGWRFLTERQKRCIYENVACFVIDEHIVVLCICKFQIQVQVCVPKNNNIAPAVLVKVKRSIEKKVRDFKKHTYRVGYKCENGVLYDEMDNSFIEESSLFAGKVFCEKCGVSKKHYVDSNVSWNIKLSKMDNPNERTYKERREETDEGLTSFYNILDACQEGNIKNFMFHLTKEIKDRTRLLERSDMDGWTLLHFAAKAGNLKIFQELLSKKLNISQRTNEQMTVLHIAAQNRNLEICNAIVHNKKYSELFHATSSNGKNACHYAVEGGSIDILQLLEAKGIDIKAKTNGGQNIFHIACIYDKLEMCQYIANNYRELIFEIDDNTWNATLYTAKQGHKDILQFLHENGVSFEHKSESDRNALHIACDNGHLEACKFIIEACPSLLNTPDHKGRHAGHFAARSGNVEIMKHLVSKRVKVTQNTKTGMNILHMACLHCRTEMCEFILSTFPALNSEVTSSGWNTAHFVAEKGKNSGHEIEIFHMITDRDDGLNIELLTDKGNSVLTLAIKNNKHDFCEYLFQTYPALQTIQGAISPKDIETKDSKMVDIVQRYTNARKKDF